MKKRQERFLSERALYAEINNTLRAIEASHKEANELEDKAKEHIRTGHQDLIDVGKFMLSKAAGIRENRILRLDNKLVKLKQALAAFKTELLPGISGDRGVVLENLK